MNKQEYPCFVHWHLFKLCRKSRFVSPIYGLSTYPEDLVDGLFPGSQRNIAEYFGVKQEVVYHAARKLVEIGFWIPVRVISKDLTMYKVLTHDEWVKDHPGDCVSVEWGQYGR